MRGYVLAVLAVAVLSLTIVKGQDLIKGETDKLVTSTFEEVNGIQTERFIPAFDARHIIFRPLVVTRQRNRELEKRLKDQRRRYKAKSTRRGSAQKGQIRAKSLKIANQCKEWETGSEKDFEIPKTVLPLSTEDDELVIDLLSDEVSSQQTSVSLQNTSPTGTLKRTELRLPVSQNLESKPHSANFVLNRPKRDVNWRSPAVQSSISPEVKSFTLSAKDSDDVRPSPNTMLMFSKPDSNRQIRDAAQNNSVEANDNAAKEKSEDDDPMETAETVLFHPLFVHRYRKAQKNLRRQLQMRPQNRPQRKPQKQQNRPQNKPATRPQQRPQPRPQVPRPQRPAQPTSQKKKPQSTRRGQYYYVAAAGPLGQWVYYPIYYY